MKTISLRDFQLKPTQYLNELPLVLTKFRKPILIVNKFKESVNKEEVKLLEVSQNENGTPQNLENLEIYKSMKAEKDEDWGQLYWEWCSANACHIFKAKPLYKCALVSLTDGNDNPAVIQGKRYIKEFICLDCLDYMEKLIPEGMGGGFAPVELGGDNI